MPTQNRLFKHNVLTEQYNIFVKYAPSEDSDQPGKQIRPRKDKQKAAPDPVYIFNYGQVKQFWS